MSSLGRAGFALGFILTVFWKEVLLFMFILMVIGAIHGPSSQPTSVQGSKAAVKENYPDGTYVNLVKVSGLKDDDHSFNSYMVTIQNTGDKAFNTDSFSGEEFMSITCQKLEGIQQDGHVLDVAESPITVISRARVPAHSFADYEFQVKEGDTFVAAARLQNCWLDKSQEDQDKRRKRLSRGILILTPYGAAHIPGITMKPNKPDFAPGDSIP